MKFTEKEKEIFNRQEEAIIKKAKEYNLEDIDDLEFKVLINNNLGIEGIIKYYFVKNWFKYCEPLIELYEINNNLITTYSDVFNNKIKAKNYLVGLFKAEDLLYKIIDQFKIILCIEVLKKGNQKEIFDCQKIISTCYENCLRSYQKYSANMFTDIKYFRANYNYKELLINDF